MQITVKTLKQEAFQVEVEESDKVVTIKEKIEKSHGHPVASQKLIFSGKSLNRINTGKILVDENPVSQYNITEKDFLVVMVAKTAVETPAAPVAAPVNAENPTPAATAEPTSGDSALLTGSSLETAIQGMMEMGFPRDQCIAAMRASFNNPDRAVEYLMTGIPEHLQAQVSAPAPTPRAPAAAAAAAPASTPAAAPAPATATAPQNLFTAAAQAAAESRRSATGGAGNTDSLAFLRDQPQFQQIREMVQANPDLLQPLLIQLGQSNPQMLQLINQNQTAFLQLLNEGGEGEEGAAPAGANHIYVTQEEQAAIQRLESLGFDRQTAVEAFLACDRDEQLAANYLFDHGADDMDDEFL
ncbi:UV excision repair protein RAD23 B [Haplosporangium bisporale]|nr:UV excision repair protein RAD23 B [Haplosporangium bisporale]